MRSYGLNFSFCLMTVLIVSGLSTPQSSAGKDNSIQFDVSGLAYWSTADPLVNTLKINREPVLDWDWKRRKTNEKRKFQNLVIDGQYRFEGHQFCGPLPAGGRIKLGFIRGAAKSAPEYFAGKWVITWEGEGTVKVNLGGAKAQKRINANRLEFTAKPMDPWTSVMITEIGDGYVGNIKAFRAEDEGLVRAGQTFRKHYIEFIEKFDVVRTMNWAGSNNSHIRSIDDMTPWEAPFWGGKGGLP